MNICVVNDRFASQGASGSYRIQNIAKGFERNGHTVTYLCPFYMSKRPLSHTPICFFRYMHTGFKNAPLDAFKFYWATSMGIFKRLLSSREKFDFIMLELPIPITKGISSVYSYLRNTTIVIDFGDLPRIISPCESAISNASRVAVDLLLQTLCLPAKLITIPSNDVKRYFESILKRKVSVVPCSVDTKHEFNPNLVDYSVALRLIPRGFRDKKIVLYLGAKGCEYLVNIAKEVILEYGVSDARYLVVGSGEYYQELVKQVIHAGLKEHFFFAGACTYSSLPMYISLAEVTCALVPKEKANTSLNNFEKVVEFMSMGKPVVTMDSLGITEFIENGRNGFVTTLNDVGFYTAKLLLDDDLRRRMGKASREICVKKFDNSIIAANLVSLVQKVNR